MDGELLFNSSDVVDHGHGAHIWTKQAEKLEWEAWQDPAIVFSAEQVRKTVSLSHFSYWSDKMPSVFTKIGSGQTYRESTQQKRDLRVSRSWRRPRRRVTSHGRRVRSAASLSRGHLSSR